MKPAQCFYCDKLVERPCSSAAKAVNDCQTLAAANARLAAAEEARTREPAFRVPQVEVRSDAGGAQAAREVPLAVAICLFAAFAASGYVVLRWAPKLAVSGQYWLAAASFIPLLLIGLACDFIEKGPRESLRALLGGLWKAVRLMPRALWWLLRKMMWLVLIVAAIAGVIALLVTYGHWIMVGAVIAIGFAIVVGAGMTR